MAASRPTTRFARSPQVAGLELPEKFCRKGKEPPEKRGPERHAAGSGHTQERDGTNGGKSRCGESRYHHHLRDGGKPLPVKDRDDVLEDRLGDDRRNQRNQSHDKADGDDGFPIRRPALPEQKFEKVRIAELPRGKPRIEKERVLFDARRELVRHGDAFGLRMRHGTVTLRRLGDQDDGFPAFLRRKIANHDAAVRRMPTGLQVDQPDMHAALLDKAAEQAEVVQPLCHFRRYADILHGHFQRLRRAPHKEARFLQLRIAFRARGGEYRPLA